MNADARQVAGRVGDHPVVEFGARVGYAVNGLMHLLMAWLAVQLVLGEQGASADQSGAMGLLAGSTIGLVSLWVAVVGFALLGIWEIPEAIRVSEAGDKVKCLAKGVVYLALAFSAFKFTQGAGESSEQQTRDFTTQLLTGPGGRALVGLIGAVVIAIGAYHVYKGWAKKFLHDLEEHPGTWAVVAGRIGYICKGIALAAVGVFFVFAGLHNNPGEATGLDGTLRQVLALPFGQIACLVVAAGFVAYAIYSFARARYADV